MRLQKTRFECIFETDMIRPAVVNPCMYLAYSLLFISSIIEFRKRWTTTVKFAFFRFQDVKRR